jgi:plastocyanin
MKARSPRLGAALAVALGLAATLAPSPHAAALDVSAYLEISNIRFIPDFLRVDFDDNVTIFVNNTDLIEHTFELDEFSLSSGILSGGAKWNETFNANRNGTFYFYCAIPGHATQLSGGRWQGMAGRLQVGPTSENGPDVIPIIVIGIIVLAATLGGVVYVARRAKSGDKK